jgi:hypothetical protein
VVSFWSIQPPPTTAWLARHIVKFVQIMAHREKLYQSRIL